MRQNRSHGGEGWVRRVTVRPQVRFPRYGGIRSYIWLSGQPKTIGAPRASRAVPPRPRDPIAELIGRG